MFVRDNFLLFHSDFYQAIFYLHNLNCMELYKNTYFKNPVMARGHCCVDNMSFSLPACHSRVGGNPDLKFKANKLLLSLLRMVITVDQSDFSQIYQEGLLDSRLRGNDNRPMRMTYV